MIFKADQPAALANARGMKNPCFIKNHCIMKNSILLTVAIYFQVITISASSTGDGTTTEASDTVAVIEIPLVSRSIQPLIQLQLNGKPAYFLVDTGSERTLVHSGHAKRYQFQVMKRKTKTATIDGYGSSRDALGIAFDVSLQLGGKPIITSFGAHDLNGLARSIFEQTGVQISGIIGTDVLRVYGISIDYGAELVRLNN